MPTTDIKQVTVKVSSDMLRRVEKVRPFVASELGTNATDSDVYRRAMSIGLSVLARKQALELGEASDDEDAATDAAERAHHDAAAPSP